MPKILLYDDEVRYEELPPICMISGEETHYYEKHKFRWTPSWVILFVCVNLLVWAIVSMLVSKSMTAHIPLAERYRRYWLKRTLYWAVPL
ncbi:MAG: hypothetical protein ACRCZF_23785, partial [Gemmataceae bacterium]